MKKNYHFKEKLSYWPGAGGGWHFLPIPKDESKRIREDSASKGGEKYFASVKVEVKINKSVWETSLFYTKLSQAFILPVNARIRRAEDIQTGEIVNFSFKINK